MPDRELSSRIFFGTVGLLALLCTVGLDAQPDPVPADENAEPSAEDTASAEELAAQAEEAAHDALRALRAIYEQAVNENDLELIKPHLDEEVTGVMVTNDEVRGYESLVAYWQRMQDLMGEGATYTTQLKPELSWIHGDIAVAKGITEDLVVMPNGREFAFSSSFTAVLVNRDGEWKIRRMQGTMNPVDNAFVKTSIRAASWIAGGTAGGVALALGLVAGFYFGRRR